MAEGIPEGDEVRRIIINAKGEVKNVVPPVSEPQKESETPEKTSGSNAAETATKIGAGIAVGEIGEALINQVGKTARKILYGGSGERGNENDPIKNAYFAKVMSMSNDPTLSVKDRVPWVKEKESRIEEFKKFDEGDFVADTRERFQTLMRTSGWDKEGGNGVYDKLVEFSENRDNDYKNRHGSELRLRGILGIAIRSEAARVLVAGVENKLRGITNDSDVDSWLNGKHYTDDELNRLARLAKENHIFDFATDAPEELVGASIKKDDIESLKPPSPEPATRGGGNEYYDAMKRFYGEREPSFELALKEFLRAERLCEFYKIEDHKLISDKIKDEDERRIFEIEVKIFNTALIKRFQGAGTMTGVGENSSLKTISTPELVYLFKNMEGYLFAMQEIANIVVNRENVGDLDFTLLDCRSQDQFILAANELDEIVKQRLVSEGRISADAAEFLAQRSVSAALNTMYAFNVFEYYDTDWKGNIRYMFKESETTAPPGKQGPSVYDRLIAKPIMDAFCPMDDFLGVVFKADEKNPTPDILVKWAKYQLGRRGVKSFKDFDAVEVVGYGLADTWRYWTVKNKELDGEKVPAGEKKEKRRVLLVPPVRPSRIWGSILDVNNVKLTGGSDEKAFLNALADHDEIDFDNVGLASNAAALYTLDAPDLDTLKNVLRGRDPKDGLPEVMKVLGTFKLGKRMELIAWIHAGMIHGIDYKTSSPNLNRKSLYASRIQREFMGLPKTDKFNLINYLRGLNDDQKIKWDS